MDNKYIPNVFLRDLGLKKNQSLLDIGYYKNGIFTLEASKIIGLKSLLYIMDFKDSAFKIRSNDYYLNMVSVFITDIDQKKGIPFKDYFFDFLMVDFQWIYKKCFDFNFFFNEIYRVIGYGKKILIFMNDKDYLNKIIYKEALLKKIKSLSLKIVKSGLYDGSYYIFLQRIF